MVWRRCSGRRYFSGLESVVLLRKDNNLLILPVRHAASGGYLLKIRNKAGDRIVNAPDFYRSQGLDDDVSLVFTVSWRTQKMALAIEAAFDTASQVCNLNKC